MYEHTSQSTSRQQSDSPNKDVEHDAEDYWDSLSDDDRRLIWLMASGMDDNQIAVAGAETPRAVAKRYRALLLRLGPDEPLSSVLAAVARTAQSSPLAAIAGGQQRT